MCNIFLIWLLSHIYQFVSDILAVRRIGE